MVIDLLLGACDLNFAAASFHPCSAKGDWQAHPAGDAVKSLESPQGADAAAAGLLVAKCQPVVDAASAPGYSQTE